MEQHEVIEAIFLNVAASYEVPWQYLLQSHTWRYAEPRAAMIDILVEYIGYGDVCALLGYKKQRIIDQSKILRPVNRNTIQYRTARKAIYDWYTAHVFEIRKVS